MFEELHKRMNSFWNNDRTLSQTDPEFIEFFSNFAYDEVVNEPGEIILIWMTRPVRWPFLPCWSDAKLGCLRNDAAGGLRNQTVVHRHQGNGVSATAYCGFGKTLPFLKKLNNFLGAANVHLPLEPQGTTTPETRAKAGEDKQIEIFGEGMRGFAQSGPEETRHINKWLAGNCFGDYYTRGGLNTREREMITLCFLAAQGGCEPQLTSHAKANMGVGQ